MSGATNSGLNDRRSRSTIASVSSPTRLPGWNASPGSLGSTGVDDYAWTHHWRCLACPSNTGTPVRGPGEVMRTWSARLSRRPGSSAHFDVTGFLQPIFDCNSLFCRGDSVDKGFSTTMSPAGGPLIMSTTSACGHDASSVVVELGQRSLC
eukprot:1663031-Rhodomonas_salina.2